MVGRLILAVCVALGPGLPAFAAPQRVVSMNLCTDQLAMMLAAPGQLVSVSYLARDSQLSAMAEDAAAYPVNHGLAEEVYALKPDLVLAGAYTARPTVEMLRRVGVTVITFQPETSLDDIRTNLRHMGAVLGREAAAEAQITTFDQGLAALREGIGSRPRAALYEANSYAVGTDSLAGQIIKAAGLDNIAEEAGLGPGGFLALEQLVLAAPDMLIRGRLGDGHARAEEILDHPALALLAETAAGQRIADRDWVCGTPHVVDAIADLQGDVARLAAGTGRDGPFADKGAP